jgi:hypothetical protein
MATIEIPPLCSCTERDSKTKECVECGVGIYTGIIDDADRAVDEILLQLWMTKIKERIRNVSHSLLLTSRQWYKQHKRQTIYMMVYDSIYHLVHESSIRLMPVDMLAPYFATELKHLRIPEKLETDVTKTKRPFNPDEHILVCLRVATKIYKSQEDIEESILEQDEKEATMITDDIIETQDGVQQEEEDDKFVEDVNQESPSYDLCIVITPSYAHVELPIQPKPIKVVPQSE